MNRIDFHPLDNEIIDVGAIASRLSSSFGGAYVTSEDLYECERNRLVNYVAPMLEAQGKPLTRIDVMLGSIDNKEIAHGPSKGVLIPLDTDHVLAGEVRETGIIFRTEAPVSHLVFQEVVRFFEGIPGTVRVVDRGESPENPSLHIL